MESWWERAVYKSAWRGTWNEGAEGTTLAADVLLIEREMNWKEDDETARSLLLFGCTIVTMCCKPVSPFCPSNETPHPAVIDGKLVLKQPGLRVSRFRTTRLCSLPPRSADPLMQTITSALWLWHEVERGKEFTIVGSSRHAYPQAREMM